MPTLGKVVLGFFLVLVDLRFEGFDVVPDLLGWLLVLVGLMPLTGRSRGFTAAGVAAGAGAVIALPLQLSEPGPVLGFLEAVVETVVVFGICTGIIALVADPRVRRTAERIRWADLALTAVGVGIGLAAGEDVAVEGAAVGPLLLLVAVTLGIVVWFLVFLWSVRQRPELLSGPGTADGLEPGTP